MNSFLGFIYKDCSRPDSTKEGLKIRVNDPKGYRFKSKSMD